MNRDISKARRVLAGILIPTYLGIIVGAPLALAAWGSTLLLAGSLVPGILAFAGAFFGYPLFAGCLSLPHQSRVVEGRMPLDTGLQSYFHRRLYGLCWTSVYYSGPIYYTFLSIPILRKSLFRLFGYRGSMAFTVYPDTWIRDLPLLDFGAGSYLANKSTIGSNMIFIRNGRKEIEVGRIKLGENVMIGHMTMIGPSTEVGDGVQIGVGCGIGRKVKIGAGATIGDTVVLDHGAKVEAGVVVPTRSYVGMGKRVETHTELSPGTIILRREKVTCP